MEFCQLCHVDMDVYSRFISCGVCESSFHANCVNPKIRGNCIDAILAADTGVRWFCVKCRRLSIANLAAKLGKFEKTFKSLAQSLNDVNDLFKVHAGDYSELKNLVDASVDAAHSSNTKTINKNVRNKNAKDCLGLPKKNSSKTMRTKARAKSSSFYDANSKLMPTSMPSKWSLFDTTDDDSIPYLCTSVAGNAENAAIEVTIAPKPIEVVKSISSASNNIGRVQNTSTRAEVSSEPPVLVTIVDSPSKSAATLEVVLPQKTIFLARLKYGTSSNNIMTYIEAGGIDINKIKCICLTAENLVNRDTASFKLIVPELFFNKLVDPKFWPANLLVREFEKRSSSKNSSKISKNLSTKISQAML